MSVVLFCFVFLNLQGSTFYVLSLEEWYHACLDNAADGVYTVLPLKCGAPVLRLLLSLVLFCRPGACHR